MIALVRVGVARRHGRRCLCSLAEAKVGGGSSSTALSTDVLASKCAYVKALYGFTYGRGAADAAAASPSDCRIRQAATLALQNYLHFRRAVPLDDAVFISSGAPKYIAAVVEHMKQESQPRDRNYEQVRKWVEATMQKEGVDEMEPFLESIGVSSDDHLLVPPNVDLCGDTGLLRTAKAMESKGISKAQFWYVLSKNKQLLSYSLRDCLDSVAMLDQFGLGPGSLGVAVHNCPAAFRVELEEDLRPAVEQLQRVGLDKRIVGKIILDAPSKLELLRRINVEALVSAIEEQLGASREAVLQMIRDDPVVLVGCSMAKVAQLVKYLRTGLLLEDDEILSLATRFPRVLVLSLEKSLVNKVDYLRKLGVQRAHAKSIILKNPQVLAYGLDSNIVPKVDFLDNLGFRRERLGALLCRYPQLLNDIVSTSLRRKANFLLQQGVETQQLADIMYNYPAFLGLKLEDIRLRLQFYRSLKVGFYDLGSMIAKNPAILGLDIDTRVKPVLDYLSSGLGFTSNALVDFIQRRPLVLSESVEELDEKVRYIEKLGFRRRSDALNDILMYAVTVSLRFVEARIEQLRNMGVTDAQIKRLIQLRMSLLHRDEGRLMSATAYYLTEMKMDMDELLKFPQYFGYSLEDRIRPRHRLIAFLKAKHVVKQDYPTCYLHMRQHSFENMFLDCHPDARAVYQGKPLQAMKAIEA